MPPQDPFATLTLADIYERQGKLRRAKTVLQRLAQDNPDEPSITRRIERIDRQLRGGDGPVSEAHPDHVQLRQDGDNLSCSWVVTNRGLQRARRMLGQDGKLVLRQSGFPAAVGLATRDMPLAETSGDIELSPPRGWEITSVAVGLCAPDGRFVSIAHSAPCPLTHSDRTPLAQPPNQ